MNPARLPRLLLAAATALLAAAPGYSAAPAASPPAKPALTLQQRIDALLKHRTRPEPLPVDPPNPFVVVSRGLRDTAAADGKSSVAVENLASAPKAGAPAAAPEFLAASSAEVLAACAVRLKIGGMIRLRDQIQLVINDVPRKEGDFIAAVWNNSIVQLRLVRLVPGQLVLRFEEAEVTLKF